LTATTTADPCVGRGEFSAPLPRRIDREEASHPPGTQPRALGGLPSLRGGHHAGRSAEPRRRALPGTAPASPAGKVDRVARGRRARRGAGDAVPVGRIGDGADLGPGGRSPLPDARPRRGAGSAARTRRLTPPLAVAAGGLLSS